MSYVDTHLLPHERIVYRTRITAWIYAQSFLYLIAALVVYFFYNAININERREMIVILLMAFFIISLLGFYIKRATSEFAVTDKRIIIKTGFIRRKSLEIFLRQVEGLYVDQGILGRILRYGTLSIIGTGGTKEPFPYIDDPMGFRYAAQNQVALAQDASAEPSARVHSP